MKSKLNDRLSKGILTGLATVALFTPLALHHSTAQADTNDSMSISAIQQSQKKLDDQNHLTNAKNQLATDQEQSREVEQDMIASSSDGLTSADDQHQKAAHDDAQKQFDNDQAQINDVQSQVNEDNGVASNNDSGTNYPVSSENAPGLISFPNAPTASSSDAYPTVHHHKGHKQSKLEQKFRKDKHIAKHGEHSSKYSRKTMVKD